MEIKEFNKMIKENGLLKNATEGQAKVVYWMYGECVEKIKLDEINETWWKYYNQFLAVIHILSLEKTYDEIDSILWKTMIKK